MNDFMHTKVKDLGSFTINGANTIAFAPGEAVNIKRIIFAFTTAHTTPAPTLTMQRRPIAGTAANEVSLGTFALAAAMAAGSVYYFDLARPLVTTGTVSTIDGSLGYTAEPDMPQILPGQDFAIVSDGGGNAGVCNVFVEYINQPLTLQTAAVRVNRIT